MTALEGVFPALVTPLSPDGGEVDEASLRRLVDRLIGEGVDGLVPCGGTGEFAALSDAERRRVVEVVYDQVGGRVPVVPHTGAGSTAAALALSWHAAEVGCAAVLLTVPYFEPISEAEAADYYAAVAEAVQIPLIAYNHPGSTGLHQSTAFLRQLASDIPAVRYVKDSSGDLAQLHDLIAEDATIRVFSGIDSLFGPALALGARAAITGGLNFLAPVYVAMLAAARGDDPATVSRLWRAVYPVAELLESNSYNAAVKAGCAAIGHPVGPPRHPARPLSTLLQEELRLRLKALQDATGLTLVAR
jgi:4-hydroxy-tetrahydrodipicolinate synthase